MSAFDADVERDQRGGEGLAGQAEFEQRAGEAHAVDQAEEEDDDRPPRVEPLREQVLECDEGDRERDGRLDDRRGQPDDAVHREAERDRMRDRERGDLPQQRPDARA